MPWPGRQVYEQQPLGGQQWLRRSARLKARRAALRPRFGTHGKPNRGGSGSEPARFAIDLSLVEEFRGGDGAYLENKRLRVSRQRTLEGALIGTGFPYRDNLQLLDPYMGMMKAVIQRWPTAA